MFRVYYVLNIFVFNPELDLLAHNFYYKCNTKYLKKLNYFEKKSGSIDIVIYSILFDFENWGAQTPHVPSSGLIRQLL